MKMAKLIVEEITPDELELISDKKINYHLIKQEKANVGNLITFSKKTELLKDPIPTNDIYKVTHVMTREECPHIAKGFAIVTIRQMVESKK